MSIPAWGTPTLVRLVCSAIVLGGAGCARIRTPTVLELMNSTPAAPTTQRASATERVGRLVRTALADAYFVDGSAGANVVSWMRQIKLNPAPLVQEFECLRDNPTEVEGCYGDLRDALLPAARRTVSSVQPAWGIPAAPALASRDFCSPNPTSCTEVGEIIPGCCTMQGDVPTITPNPNPAGSGTCQYACRAFSSSVLQPVVDSQLTPEASNEVDAQRFVANALTIGSSLIQLEHSLGRRLTDSELQIGVGNGAEEAANYVEARPLRREVSRPSTAIVMSGGAATGAFTAGFIWRLLDMLRMCRSGGYADCQDARIDIVVGASTGSLVAAITKLFHVAGQEKPAMDLLVDKYTCVDESKLYCVNDALIWKVATDVRGLVQFRGIRQYLSDVMASAPFETSPTELVTMTVDYDTGDLFAISDKDPVDATDTQGRIDAILASIVEPLMADPVDSIRRTGSAAYRGTFLDGGIRSGLPVLEAMHRGAERVLAISTSGIEADPIDHPDDALSIVLRTIDLLVQQPRVGELQQAEFTAVSRRMVEYGLCADHRLTSVTAKIDRETFCRRDFLFPPREGPQAATSLWIGPMSFPEVARSWQTEWIYRPENPHVPGAAGYSFDPVLMRRLFQQGMTTFEARCDETVRMLGLPASVKAQECTAVRARQMERDLATVMKPLGECVPKTKRIESCAE